MKVLVLTETDACCGPCAAAFLRDYSNSLVVVSAGRNPLQSVEPMMVEVMKECLIDLSGYAPQSMEPFQMDAADMVFECPDIPCPATIEEARGVRDFIKNEAYLFFRGLPV